MQSGDSVLFEHGRAIHYLYDAQGVKLRKEVYGENGYLTQVVDYCGPVVYRDGAPDYILTGEGRLVFREEKEPVYEYFLTDHLGNTRVTFRVEGDSVSVVQENHYYPFGLSMAGLDNSGLQEEDATQNPSLYNGKEFQGDEGLGWYDYGARFYDAQVGRWWTTVPSSERYINISPFVYCANNPISFIDPDGQKIVIANNTKKALTNLAKIAATSLGRQRLNRLITSPYTYTARSTFWTSSSAYDGNGEIGLSRTVYYVGSVWRPSLVGGSLSSMYVMGHELNHAYDHDITGRAGNRDLKTRERSSVFFTNYLRSVYGDGDHMRTSYSGLGLRFTKNENVYNRQKEKVSDFTKTLDVSISGNYVIGFSYKTNTNGQKPTTSYVISLKTETGQYVYRVFDNEKDYKSVVEEIQILKKKESEKK